MIDLASPPSRKLSARGKLNILRRHRAPGDPAILDAQREFATESIAEYIERKIAETPPLSAEQIERLRRLLPPPGGAAA